MQDNYFVWLSIFVILFAILISSSVNLLERCLFKLQKHFLMYKMRTAYEEKNISDVKENLLNNSIIKLRSNDLATRRLAIKELYYEWNLVDEQNKEIIMKNLIRALNREKNFIMRREIIGVLYRFINE